MSNEPTKSDEWTKVSNVKSKKQKNKKNKQNGTDANEDAVKYLNNNNPSLQAPKQTTSNLAQSTDQPCVFIVGDSMLEFINGQKLSSQISNHSLTYVKAFLGATVEDISNYIIPSLCRKPEEIILMLA